MGDNYGAVVEKKILLNELWLNLDFERKNIVNELRSREIHRNSRRRRIVNEIAVKHVY